MIDAHLHLQFPEFDGILDKVIEAARKVGVKAFVVNGTSPEDWNQVASLATEVAEIIPFFGVHPWKVNELRAGWEEELDRYLEAFPGAGVGEIGLDKWIRNHDIGRQRETFLRQLELAEKKARPVTVHCLKAWGHLSECLKSSKFQRPFLLHSFGGPTELIGEFLKREAYFSLSGYFLRPDKTKKRDAFLSIPRERILLETDAPDMLPPDELIQFPLSREGKEINHPANLRAIYEAYARWKELPVSEVISATSENFRQFTALLRN
ncbi:MAG: TatD family hydrolase [Verrucomicrobiales bacterium]|nr:TatD family hydrolase [Verrucomicrobiales bacterium]